MIFDSENVLWFSLNSERNQYFYFEDILVFLIENDWEFFPKRNSNFILSKCFGKINISFEVIFRKEMF